MIIYPAIDLRDGKCVRLTQGDYSIQQVFSDSPTNVALGFEQAGAQYLHVVDLDGAKAGVSKNLDAIRGIVSAVTMPVQLGGGIRTMNNIEQMLDLGVRRVILGTAAVANKALVETAVKKYGKQIAVGIDAKDGRVAVEGWTKASSQKAIDFGSSMQELGVSTIIYTDIARDGMLQGPNLMAMQEMVNAVSGGVDVIASGGVTQLADIQSLKRTGVSGVIIGKAIYVGNFRLEEALREAGRI